MTEISEYAIANNSEHTVFIHESNELVLLEHDQLDGELTRAPNGTYSLVFHHFMQDYSIVGLSDEIADELRRKVIYIGKMISGELLASPLNLTI